MGGGRGVENTENTQKSQRSHKYKWEPLDKKNISEKWGGGWMCHINRIKESISPSVKIAFQGPGPLGNSLIGLPGL